jgi:hypothetical protein
LGHYNATKRYSAVTCALEIVVFRILDLKLAILTDVARDFAHCPEERDGAK